MSILTILLSSSRTFLLLMLLCQRTLAFFVTPATTNTNHHAIGYSRRETGNYRKERQQQHHRDVSQRLAPEDVASLVSSAEHMMIYQHHTPLHQHASLFLADAAAAATMNLDDYRRETEAMVLEMQANPHPGITEEQMEILRPFKRSVPPGLGSIDACIELFRSEAANPRPPGVLDLSQVKPLMALPGATAAQQMVEQRLAADQPLLLPVELETQLATQWATEMSRVFELLPLAAFTYCLIEFLFLRPGLDRYWEDVVADPTQAATETAAVVVVRMGLMAGVALLTYLIFYTPL